MTEPAIPAGTIRDATAVHRTDHELISFAVFLDYRAKRMRAPVAEVPTPDEPTTPKGVAPAKS